MDRNQKREAVAELKDRFEKSNHMFVTEYRGLKVSEITDLRTKLRDAEAKMAVVKNNLALRALPKGQGEELDPFLKGPTAIVWGYSDPVVLAKILSKFQEDAPALKLKAAYLDGKLMNEKEVIGLAKLPSKEELYAKLLSTLNAPASNFVRVLNAIPEKVARVFDAVAKTKS